MDDEARVVVHTPDGIERYPPNVRASEILEALLGSQKGRLKSTDPNGTTYLGSCVVPTGNCTLVRAAPQQDTTGGSGNVVVRVVREVKIKDADDPTVPLGKISVVNDKVQISAIEKVLTPKNLCLVLLDGLAVVMDDKGWSVYNVPDGAHSITLTTAPKPGTKVFPAYGAPRRGWSILPAWTARA